MCTLIEDIDIAVEAFMGSTNDITFNINKWRRANGSNVLFVTGFSGSGKSTLAEKLEKPEKDIYMFEIDSFYHGKYDASGIGLMDEFKDKYPQHISKIGKEGDINATDFTKLVMDFISLLHTKGDKLFILEGIQIYDYLPPAYVSRFPIIIKGTSAVSSMYRRFIKRENKIPNLKDWCKYIKWYRKDNRSIENLKSILK